MKKLSFLIIITVLIASCQQSKQQETTHYQNLCEDFADLRFGMFICYNIMSYGAGWGESNYDISTFNPTQLDCNQWAKAAKTANMKFGLLTTKHHEGFCLWDSEYTEYDVASTPYKEDIVQQYVDAFRKNDLKVGLYYSIWDSTHGIDKDSIGAKEMEFIKGQITELLSNYGKIDYFVIDGWYWRMGHREVPYNEIRQLIRDLQPDCLITDHTHLQATYHVDIPYFEGPFGAFPAEDNKMASALGHCSVKGNGWFWSEKTPNGLNKDESAETIVDKLATLESRYCTFLLNCMPNRDGLLDTLYIDLLSDIGGLWQPDLNRPALPLQDKPMLYEIPCESATATSGDAMNLIDSRQVSGTEHTDWVSEGDSPQSITLDLGAVYSDVELLQIVPKHRCKPAPETKLTEGNITSCKMFASANGETFELISTNSWGVDGNMRNIEFEPTTLRYIRIDVLEWNGENAVATEVAVGAYSKAPLEL